MEQQPRKHSAAITSILCRACAGEERATDELLPLVYDELRLLAAKHLAEEREGHTLQATALAHEAYLRLVGPEGTTWENRAHFFGAAARAIRRILVDHARARARVKRGGGVAMQSLEDSAPGAPSPTASGPSTIDLVSLDDALERLAALDPQKARIVEMRFFGGLSVKEVAAALGTSESTCARDWQFARVWLFHAMGGGEE